MIVVVLICIAVLVYFIAKDIHVDKEEQVIDEDQHLVEEDQVIDPGYVNDNTEVVKETIITVPVTTPPSPPIVETVQPKKKKSSKKQ